jgi:glycosyltransferase involved in cell wall biosynthesis
MSHEVIARATTEQEGGPREGRMPPERLHVAIVDEELPYPATSGKRIRTLNLVQRLARRHRLTYFCHRNSDPDEARRAAAFFAAEEIETVVVDRPVPRKSGLGFYCRLAANLFSPLPYSVATHSSPALRQAVQAYAARNLVDLWQCEWTPYAQTLRGLAGQRVLVMAHNVESQIWQRYFETEANPLKRWYIKRQWRKFERFERRAFAEATRAVFVSEPDAALARERFGAECVAVVDNGVDTAYFRPEGGPRDPRRILFLGSLDWRPNLDAVLLLLDEVFPRVRAAEPTARLCLVGRNPPEWLARRARQEANVELAENVPDVRPYLGGCGVLAVPLRIGGGSRLKILEALAAQTPVVSTTVGAEGLHLEAGRHLIIADGVEQMTRELLRVLRTPGPAREMAAQGREVVLARYDWDVLACRLEEVWSECVATGPQPAAVGVA